MLKRMGILLLAIAAISGCYFPSDFTADLQLDREGRYRFTYVGKLTDVSMARHRDVRQFTDIGEAISAFPVELKVGGEVTWKVTAADGGDRQ